MDAVYREQSVKPAREVQRVVFNGTAREYFGIWIVNMLLTIVTIGIYSAWAKVRRNRYFYGNTVLAGRSFDYHASGKQILIGRIILFVGYIALNIVSHLSPIMALVAMLLGVIVMPFLVARGLRFSARVTSYRNIRFDFTGTAGGAFKAIILGSFLSVVTLGLFAPIARRWLSRYIARNLRYGDKVFDTDPEPWRIFRAMLIAYSLFFGPLIAVAILGYANATCLLPYLSPASELDQQRHIFVLIIVFYVLFLVLVSIASLFYQAAVRNIVWSAATFDSEHQLFSDVEPKRYVWIALSGFVATVLTLGLLRPWAAIRSARYTYQHSGIVFTHDTGEIFGPIEDQGNALGAAYLDFEGFDFGF